MKKYLLTIVLLGTLSVTQAQEKKKVSGVDDRLVITLPTKNNLAAASSEPLESVTLTIRADTVSSLSVRYRPPSSNPEAESLNEKEQKGGVQTPFIPNVQIKNLKNHRVHGGKYQIDQVELFRDSTVYFYQLAL